MKRLKESTGRWNDNGNILGLFFGLAILAVLLPGILSADRLGTVDNGRYEQVLLSAGLEYLPEDLEDPSTLQYNRVIEEYGYGSFSYWKLFAPNGENSILYPIALIRLVTEPFGLHFSTQYLAILYAIALALGTWGLVRGCAHLGGWLAAIPGALLVLIAADRNFAAYLNSLYPMGTVAVSLVLLLAAALRMLTYGSRRFGSSFTLFALAAAFCLNSSYFSYLFAPFVLLVGIVGMVMAWKNGVFRPASSAVVFLMLLAAVSSSFQLRDNSADLTSDAAAYHAVFMGLLETSENPSADLAEFGLDESYLEDVGKSYYLSEDSYAHCPRNDETLFEKVNSRSIGKFYLRHPLRLLQVANGQSENYSSFESSLTLRVGQTTLDDGKITRYWSTVDTLMRIFLPGGYGGAVCLALLALVAAVWLAIRFWNRGRALALLSGGALLALNLGAVGLVPMHLRYMGRDFLTADRIGGLFAMLLCFGGVCVALGDGIGCLSAWFRTKQEEDPDRRRLLDWCGYLQPRSHRLVNSGGLISRIAGHRLTAALAVLVLALAMSYIVQFAAVRAGCVNNGDFGRMMDQLGIIWQGDIFYNSDAQLGHRVIETYAYRDSFDWTSLTFLNPKYSLVYPAALVRLICSWTGQAFSTWYLSLVMNGVLIICIVSITYDLHDLLKGYAMLLGMLLCGVFLCESYLVWFNSLFGESCMFMGLFMVIACCVHLAVRPANKCWFTVLLLLFSGRILVCAKAQMLVTLPIVLVLVILFALYHRPLPLKGLIPYTLLVMISCALICLECITVYNDNSGISERQTVWQSTFYGALMITDDPEAAMDELGIDKRMMPDIGKDAYHSDDDYVISPNSAEADTALYDHVNTFTMVKYYIRHPIQLLKMLNHAAGESRTVYNGFRAYLGQDYSGEHDEVNRLGLWQYWRSFFTCGSFLGYVVLYGCLIALCVFGVLLRPEMDIRWKWLAVTYLGVMVLGAVQYPLSVIGNGFADNQKQMFGFMMCHDVLTLSNITMLLWLARRYAGRLGEIAPFAKPIRRKRRQA